jgi:hypothetical protein
MNKFYRVFSVIALTLSVALWSCKGDQGDQGPAGPQGVAGANGTNGTNGTNGKDGNANVKIGEVTVKVADWKTVDAPGLGSGATVKRGAFTQADANIKATSFVVASVKIGNATQGLPATFFKDTDGSTEQLNFASETGKITFYYNAQTSALGGKSSYAPSSDLTFSYAVVERTVALRMQSEGMNPTNYNEVVKYLNTNN